MIVILVASLFVVDLLGSMTLTLSWNREEQAKSFDGAVLFLRHRALQANVLRKMQTLGEIQCSQACLSENSCVAQTYCESWTREKGVCFLHENGIKEDQTDDLVEIDECTYQQFISFDVSILDIYL